MTESTNQADQQTKAGEQLPSTAKEGQHDSPPSSTLEPALPARNWRLIRVPAVLHAQLKRAAADKGLSIHALISKFLNVELLK